jgi:phospholipid/cholesterol/gamma-HCH transport system substrate-binding protein
VFPFGGKMEQQNQNLVRSGAFVLLGFIVIAFSIISLGGDRWFFSKKSVIYVDFSEAQGLASGSIVSLAGLTIGNVADLELISETNKVRVSLKIEDKYLSKLTNAATAELRTQGALGDKYVMIITRPGEGQGLQPGAILQSQTAKDIFGVISERGQEADKVFEIIKEVHQLTRTLNEQNRVETMIKNFQEASSEMKATAKETRLLISSLRQDTGPKLTESVTKLDRILTKIDSGEGTLGALINDSSVHDSLKSVLGGSDRKKNMKDLIRSSNKVND